MFIHLILASNPRSHEAPRRVTAFFNTLLDTLIVSKNDKNATINDFKRLLDAGNYPGGSGEFTEDTDFGSTGKTYELTEPTFAYHYVQFIAGYLSIHDRCRHEGEDPEHQERIVQIVEELSGASSDSISDAIEAEDYIQWQE